MALKKKKEVEVVVEATPVAVEVPEAVRREYLLKCLDTCRKEGWTKIGQIEQELARLNEVLK